MSKISVETRRCVVLNWDICNVKALAPTAADTHRHTHTNTHTHSVYLVGLHRPPQVLHPFVSLG